MEKWSSKLGFIAASVGAAAGIGNIWRFPYIMGSNGGGTFLLVYLICIGLFGIPLMLLELASGRKFKSSVVKSFEKINHKIKKLALIPVITVFFILGYYFVITGWVLNYFVSFSSGYIPEFNNLVNSYNPLIFTFLSIILSGAVVLFGVKAIEKSSKILIPFLFLLVFILVLRSLSSPDSIQGIIHYFKPNMSDFFNPKIWLIASGQALFSLSAGYGIMITYGNYLKSEESILKSTITISFLDVLFSIMSAIIIFSAVFSFGFSTTEGPKLAFVVMPHIFQKMSFGFLFGSIFFLLLFISAITSAISMLEFLVKNSMDQFSFPRRKSAILVIFSIILLSTIVSLSYSGLLKVNLLEIFDNVFGSYFTLISAIIICLVVAWHWDIDDLIREMGIEDDLTLEKIGKIGEYIENLIAYTIVLNLIKFVVPVILFILFIVKILGL